MGLKTKSLQLKKKLIKYKCMVKIGPIKKMLCAQHRLGTTAPEFVEEAGEDQRRGRRKVTR